MFSRRTWFRWTIRGRYTRTSFAGTSTGSSTTACTGFIPTAPPASSSGSRPRSGGGSSRSFATRRPAACRCWPEPRRPTFERPLPPARPMRNSGPGGRHRLAVLLPAQPRIGLRLLPRDRAGQPDRRHALQHPHVRQPDRHPDHQAAGGVPEDRRDQGLLGRPGVHDAADLRRTAACGPTSAS